MKQSEDETIKNEISNSAQETRGVIASGPAPEKKPNFFKTKNGKILLAVLGAVVVFGAGIGTALILMNNNKPSETVANKSSDNENSTKDKTEEANKKAAAETTKTSNSGSTSSNTSSSSTASSSAKNVEFGVADGYLNIPSWGIRILIPNGFAISYRMDGNIVYITGYSEKRGARPDYADITKNTSGLGAISLHNKGSKVMYGEHAFDAPAGDIYYEGSQAYFSRNAADKKAEEEDRDVVLNMLANNIRFITDPYE